MNLYNLGEGFYEAHVEIKFKFITPATSVSQQLERDQLNVRLEEKAARFARWLEAQFESGKDSDWQNTEYLKRIGHL